MVASATQSSKPGDDAPVFVISVAAELAGMHAQTLRQYDRLGLVIPSRTRGGGRRYSGRDVHLLREIQRLSQEEGVSLAGIARILQLQDRVETLEAQVEMLHDRLEAARSVAGARVFAAGPDGQIVALRPGQRPDRRRPGTSIVIWGERD